MVIRIPTKIRRPQKGFAELVFLLGMFLKQFYVRQSGDIQISDVVIMTSVAMLLLSGRMRFSRIDITLIIFVAFTFIINGLHSIYYSRNMLLPSVYLLYNLAAILAFRVLAADMRFVTGLAWVMKLNLLTQLAVYFLGIGRYHADVRYQGTFNDPNQFGFFVLCCFFILFLCCTYSNRRLSFIWYFFIGFLVLISSSRGLTLAYLIFLFFAVLQPFLSGQNTLARALYLTLFGIFCVVALLASTELLSLVRGLDNAQVSFLMSRFSQVGGRFSLWQHIYNFLFNRKMLRILYEPMFFLFGSGEGYFERFSLIENGSSEIHSTIVALGYYYGVLPYAMFIKWLRDNIEGIPRRSIGVFIALILEAFTLANHRQPLFWIILVMGNLLADKFRERRTDWPDAKEDQIQRNRPGVPGWGLSGGVRQQHPPSDI